MKKYLIVLLISFVALSIACNRESKKETKKPNIIFIMADDLGYNEVGAYGQKIIKTPNIDKLADEGMKFTDHYAGSPVCAPSRCVLLTGLHPGHAYVRGNYELGGYRDDNEGGQLPLPDSTKTLGTFLKAHGYVTGAIGKWGLGFANSSGQPSNQGFDYFYGYLCQKQAHDYYPTHLWENNYWDTLRNAAYIPHEKLKGDPLDPKSYDRYKGPDYSMDKMMEKAERFIRDNKDTSFFLYVPFTVPHLALQIPDDEPSLEYYKKLIPDTPYVGNKGYLPNMFPRATYAAMVTRMDSEIGRIMDILNELGLDDNTVVFFTSDNGPTFNRLGGSDSDYFESAGQLRGLKGSVYEGGIRVPLIAWWKDKVKPGTVSNHISGFEDFYVTFADIIGTKTDKETDGVSLLPVMLEQDNIREHPFIYREFPSYGGQVSVRLGDWKAVRQKLKKHPDASIELYNLKEDIGETNDVAALHPDIVEKMKVIMDTSHVNSTYFPFPALDSLKPGR